MFQFHATVIVVPSDYFRVKDVVTRVEMERVLRSTLTVR